MLEFQRNFVVNWMLKSSNDPNLHLQIIFPRSKVSSYASLHCGKYLWDQTSIFACPVVFVWMSEGAGAEGPRYLKVPVEWWDPSPSGRSTTFVLFQWGDVLSVVILTTPWIMVSPEEMKKDAVGWLSRPWFLVNSRVREVGAESGQRQK